MTANSMHFLIIGILVLNFAVDTILNFLNARKFGASPPREVSNLYDAEKYAESQAYKRVNYRFGILASAVSLVAILGLLTLGGFALLDSLAASITQNPTGQALAFFGFLLAGGELLSLPLSYYQVFVIEERFGFNKQGCGLFFADKAKGFLLTLVIGGLLLAAIMWLYNWAGPGFWVYAWALVAAFTIFMNLFYSRFVVPLFNRQEPLADGPLKDRILEYAGQVGFELKKIFVIDGSRRSTKANAYFSGFGSQRRVTLYDTLLKDLDDQEVIAVLAHEVGHYKRHHIVYNLIASLAITGLTLLILSVFINRPELSLAIGVERPSFHAALLGFGLLYTPISEVTGLIMNYLSRRFEFQADDFARRTYAPEPLVSSLKKLARNHLSNLTPHPAYVFMHYSHPPLWARIRKLLARDSST